MLAMMVVGISGGMAAATAAWQMGYGLLGAFAAYSLAGMAAFLATAALVIWRAERGGDDSAGAEPPMPLAVPVATPAAIPVHVTMPGSMPALAGTAARRA